MSEDRDREEYAAFLAEMEANAEVEALFDLEMQREQEEEFARLRAASAPGAKGGGR